MKSFRFAALAAVLLLCIGCTGSPVSGKLPEVSYTQVYRRISAPYDAAYLFQGNVLQTVWNGHTYEFPAEMEEERRGGFLAAQEDLCALLDSHGIATDGLLFRVLGTGRNWSDSGSGAAYFSDGSERTWTQALTTLQAALGDYVNYGYAYALADRIAAELGWQQDAASSAVEAAGLDGVFLNLTYPCFDEDYTAPEGVAACKDAARELLAGLEDIWSEEAFLAARQEFAADRGAEFSPVSLEFAYYGKGCPLKIRTRHLEVFREAAYTQDRYVTLGYLSEDYFSGAERLFSTFQWLDQKLEALREIFGQESAPRVSAVLKGEAAKVGEWTISGLYTKKEIQAATLHCLAHEYTHYLYALSGGSEAPEDEWLNEVAACYYTAGQKLETYRLLARLDSQRAGVIEEQIGHPLETAADMIRFIRKQYRARENPRYLYDVKSEYTLREAFGEYFVRTYGEEVFRQCMLAPAAVKERTGKTMDEILDDWQADMEDPEKDSSVRYPYGF